MTIQDDIETVRHALQATKTIAYIDRQGALHKLWAHLLEATRALDRIEQQVTTQQMPLFQTHTTDTADYKRHV
jgi:hypothetical protein